MIFISEKEMPGIAPLFAGVKESMVWSCLQGEMGRAWADNAQNPGCARIITGDFCFFAGNSEAAGAEELIRQFPEGNPSLVLPADSARRRLEREDCADLWGQGGKDGTLRPKKRKKCV